MATKSKTKPDTKPQRDPHEVLTVETLAPVRAYVTVDDERHFLKQAKDFGLIRRQELERDSAEYDKLWERGQGKRLTQNEANRLDQLQDDLFDLVLLDPAKLRAQLDGKIDELSGEPVLSGGLKREIVLAFTNAPVLIALAQQEMETTEPESSSTLES